SAPFHSPLMHPAAEIMKEAFEEVEFRRPTVPLVANVTAKETTDPGEIKALLVEQVTQMVRWRETVLLFAANHVEDAVELVARRPGSTRATRHCRPGPLPRRHPPPTTRRSRRSRTDRPPRPRRRGSARQNRHPGQQRRHHSRQSRAAHEGRGLAGRPRCEPDR